MFRDVRWAVERAPLARISSVIQPVTIGPGLMMLARTPASGEGVEISECSLIWRREEAETLDDPGGSRASASSVVLVVRAAEGSVHAPRRGRLAGLRGEGLEQVGDQPRRGLGSRSGGGGNH